VKILLVLHTYAADGDFGSFALQLIEGFSNTGAEVHVIKANDLVDGLGATSMSKALDSDKIRTYFNHNKFDLVFNTNHSGMGGIIKKCIGHTPVISWLVDRNPFLHAGKCERNLFRKTNHVITSSRVNVENLIRRFGLSEDNVHYYPFMTNPSSFSFVKDKTLNLCFIGSFFVNEGVISDLLLKNYGNKYYSRIMDAIASLEDDFDQDDRALVRRIGIRFPLLMQNISAARFKGSVGNIISNKKRLDALSAVSDLGLHLYGTENISALAAYSPRVASCFHSSMYVNSRARLCDVYDRSKIGVNINHHQATTGLSYRVFDILASSALLVTNKQKNSDLDYLFGKDNPIPTYATASQLRKICQHFLQSDSERNQLVRECNKLIAGKHTFDVRAIDIIKIAYPDFVAKKEKPKVEFIDSRRLLKDESFQKNANSGCGIVDYVRVMSKIYSYAANRISS
jgi:spore maturation protein CgeB